MIWPKAGEKIAQTQDASDMFFPLLYPVLKLALFFAVMPEWTLPESHRADAVFGGMTCFEPTPETLVNADGQEIQCTLAHPGKYPPAVSRFNHLTKRCCFWERPEYGVFWAVGEAVMSSVMTFYPEIRNVDERREDIGKAGSVEPVSSNADSCDGFGEIDGAGSMMCSMQEAERGGADDGVSVLNEACAEAKEDGEKFGKGNGAPYRTVYQFELKPAQLLDILALDDRSDDPVMGARVTLSDDAVHIVSSHRQTDRDGYAVFPVLPGNRYVVTVRAGGYLMPAPKTVKWEEGQEETVIELDPGLNVSGVVVNARGEPVTGAKIHVDVVRPDGGFWSSDLDLPKAISSVAGEDEFVPHRGSFSSSEHGKFYLETIPKGKIRLYAEHSSYSPSPVVQIDATDNDELTTVRLVLRASKRAWVRVESPEKTAVSSTVTVLDEETGFEAGVHRTPSSGAAELKNLPEKARFLVTAPGFVPLLTSKTVKDDDEIIFSLVREENHVFAFRVQNEEGEAVSRATISPADSDVRRKYPGCLAKTNSQGVGSLEGCPPALWVDIYHPDYAHWAAWIDREVGEVPVYLSPGGAVRLELVDEKTGEGLAEVSCEVKMTFEAGQRRQTIVESVKSNGGRLELLKQPDVMHRVTCTAPPGRTREVSFRLDEAPQKIEFPHFVTQKCVVLDAWGGSVSYARIDVDGRQEETDEYGRIELMASPGETIGVYHWLHGQMTHRLNEGDGDCELRLPDKAPLFDECLSSHKLPYITDSAAVQIDVDVPLYQIKRGDYVESCTNRQIVLVRDGHRIRVNW